MKLIRKILKWILYLLAIPIAYLLVALILTVISVNPTQPETIETQEIYLSTNGVHLDIVMPILLISEPLKEGLSYDTNDKFLAFGWGDENFYLNTPTWGDLTFQNAFGAMFLQSSTLIHLTRHKSQGADWTSVNIDDEGLKKLNNFIFNTFKADKSGDKVLLKGKGYFSNDDFYKAHGSYSCLNTCNTWVNNAFKASQLKACLWTPFDFGLIYKYSE